MSKPLTLGSASLVLVWLPTALLGAQAPAQIVRDLKGVVQGAAADARVLVTLWHNDMERGTVEPLAEAVAKPDGSFEFEGVKWFEKQKWGFNAVQLVARSGDRIGIVQLRSDGTKVGALRVEVKKSIEIRGVLRDEETGKPIENAWVWPSIFGKPDSTAHVWLTSPLLPWHALTDAKGRFVLKGLPDMEPIRLMAGGPDHALTWVEVEDRIKVEAMLKCGGRITGKVLMPDGKPAAGVPVTATGQGVGYGRTQTDDQGQFVISSLAPDRYKVFASSPELTVIAVLNLDVKSGEVVEGQTVHLVRGGFIIGRIVDADTGKPIVPGPHTDVAMYGPARGPGGSCECTPVLDDGTFRIRAPAGKNRIYLRGAMGWSEPSETVDVVEGQETVVEWKVRKGQRRRR